MASLAWRQSCRSAGWGSLTAFPALSISPFLIRRSNRGEFSRDAGQVARLTTGTCNVQALGIISQKNVIRIP